jgi:hypothetical protein
MLKPYHPFMVALSTDSDLIQSGFMMRRPDGGEMECRESLKGRKPLPAINPPPGIDPNPQAVAVCDRTPGRNPLDAYGAGQQ